MNGAVILRESRTSSPANQWRGKFGLGSVAKQIATGRNADGRLEIFYIGLDNAVHHNWLTQPNGLLWSGEMRLSSRCAQQIGVGQNADGCLEIFYTGDDGALFIAGRPWRTAFPGQPQPVFRLAKRKQVAIGRNADGRLEIFYLYVNAASAITGRYRES